jgi:hypothetical protein
MSIKSLGGVLIIKNNLLCGAGLNSPRLIFEFILRESIIIYPVYAQD